jgi:nucleotide sugar dehydrogenase
VTASAVASRLAEDSRLYGFRICVVGLGKIGLALAAQYVSKGWPVFGADIDPNLVKLVARGEAPANSEPGLAERIASGTANGLLRATVDTTEAVAASNVIVVIVPLLTDPQGQPDFRALDSATAAIASGLQPGTLVIYETTLPLGATRDRFGPLLERSGLRHGQDLLLAFSPERVYVGRTFEDLARYPKIVGGTSPSATRAAASFYSAVLDAQVMEMPDSETAEFVKLAETTYRDVNIGLANDLARFAQARGVDAVTAFRAANTQPFSNLHTPGIGVGGHCIPVYPRFLMAQAQPGELEVVRHARALNDGMAEYAVDLLEQRLGSLRGKRVLILGYAYRGGVKEASCSSALLAIQSLQRRGGVPLLHDPLFSDAELAASGAVPAHLDGPLQVDAVILQTDHAEYFGLEWSLFQGCQLVLDGRNVLDQQTIEAAGLSYVAIGRGNDGRHG